MCNTSNALYAALVLSKQTTNCLKLFAVNSGSRSSSHRQSQAAGPATEKARLHMWRDCVEGQVVDDDWQNADGAVTKRLR